MSRKKLIRTNEFPYHITARSNNKEWFYLPATRVWKIFTELQEVVKIKFNVKITTSVLMNNHFHMLIWTPDCNVDKVMQYFLKNMADRINFEAKRINHVFGGPYKWCLVSRTDYYANVIRYIAQNPLRANIVSAVEEYPYVKLATSSEIHPCLTKDEFLQWLNSRVNDEEQIGMQSALKRRVFNIGRNSNTSKPYKVDTAPFPKE